MITPVDIQSRTFKTGLGYDKKEVDAFKSEVLSSFEELYRSNIELKDKINMLNEGLQHYKNIEGSLQKALILAEKTADETTKTAELKAKNIEAEAVNKANGITVNAKLELDRIYSQTRALVQQHTKYKAQIKQLLATEQEILDSKNFDITMENLEAYSQEAQNSYTSKFNFTYSEPNINQANTTKSNAFSSLADDISGSNTLSNLGGSQAVAANEPEITINSKVFENVSKKFETVSTPEPIKVEEPVQTVEPVKVEEPVQIVEPVKVKEPVQVVEPVKVEEPVQTVEPVKVEEPVRIVEPVKVEDPVRVVEPVKVEEPTKSVEPTINMSKEEKTDFSSIMAEFGSLAKEKVDTDKPIIDSTVNPLNTNNATDEDDIVFSFGHNTDRSEPTIKTEPTNSATESSHTFVSSNDSFINLGGRDEETNKSDTSEKQTLGGLNGLFDDLINDAKEAYASAHEEEPETSNEDAYVGEVEPSRANRRQQNLLGNDDDDESGFEFLSSLD